jgi:hypothetical protein
MDPRRRTVARTDRLLQQETELYRAPLERNEHQVRCKAFRENE